MHNLFRGMVVPGVSWDFLITGTFYCVIVFSVQGTWEGPTGYRMIFTSQVNIIPDTRPHEPCTDPVSCFSVLV